MHTRVGQHHHRPLPGLQPAAIDKDFTAKMAKQDFVGSTSKLRMPFEAVALEILHTIAFAIGLADFFKLLADRIAEDHEPALTPPVLAEDAAKCMARLGEIVHIGISWRRDRLEWWLGTSIFGPLRTEQSQ